MENKTKSVLIEHSRTGFLDKLGRNRGIVERAYQGKSKAAAIKAKCIECVNNEIPVETIGNCECYRCPLWGYRPYQNT